MRSNRGSETGTLTAAKGSVFTTRIVHDCLLPDHHRLRTVVVQREKAIRAVTFQYIDDGGSQLQEFILYDESDVALALPFVHERSEGETESGLSIGDEAFAISLRQYGVQYSMRTPLLVCAMRVTPIEQTMQVATAISLLCGWPAASPETQIQQPRLRLA